MASLVTVVVLDTYTFLGAHEHDKRVVMKTYEAAAE